MQQEKPHLGKHQNRSWEEAQHSGPPLLEHELGLQLRTDGHGGRAGGDTGGGGTDKRSSQDEGTDT